MPVAVCGTNVAVVVVTAAVDDVDVDGADVVLDVAAEVEVVDEADGDGVLEQAASETAPAPSASTVTNRLAGRQRATPAA